MREVIGCRWGKGSQHCWCPSQYCIPLWQSVQITKLSNCFPSKDRGYCKLLFHVLYELQGINYPLIPAQSFQPVRIGYNSVHLLIPNQRSGVSLLNLREVGWGNLLKRTLHVLPFHQACSAHWCVMRLRNEFNSFLFPLHFFCHCWKHLTFHRTRELWLQPFLPWKMKEKLKISFPPY